MEPPAPPPTSPAPGPVRRRRRLRWVVRGVAVLLALILLLTAAAVLSLRSVSVRRAILDRVAAYLEQEMGIVLRAEDVSLGLGGDIELTGVRVGAPGAPPFATAERVRVVPDLRSLRREVIVLRSVEVDGPRLDLNAPVPALKEQPEEPGAAPRRIDVLAFRLDRGEVLVAPPTPEMARWLDGWGARGIAARGSFRGERLDVEAEAAEIEVRQPGVPPQRFRLETAAAGRLDEPLEVRKLLLIGDGLSLTASGRAALAAEGPFDVRFQVDAAPGKVAPRQVPGGEVHAEGRIAWPENAGRVRLKAAGLPAEAVRPYVPADPFADLSLAGTVVDAEATLSWEAGAPDRATGPAEATWRRGTRVLARAEARASTADGGLRVAFAGDLLPRSPGRRHFEGAVLTPSWAEIAQTQNQGTAAALRIPDLGAALAELRAVWPRLVPTPPAGVPVRGALNADVKLAGAFASPTADLTASWEPEPGARVDVKGRARIPAAEGTARVEIASLPLGSFASGDLAGLDGTVSGTADLAGSLRSARTRLDLTADRLAVPLPDGSPASVESVHARADGVLRLDPLLYRGSLSVEGAGLTAMPDASSTARIAQFRLAGDGSFDLDRLAFAGPLRFESSRIALDGETPVRAERLDLRADGRFSPDLRASSGWIELEAEEARAAGETVDAALQARLQGGEVWIPALSAFSGDRAVAGSAHLTVDPLLKEADFDLQLLRPFEPAVRSAEVSARLRQGVLTLAVPRLEGDAGSATLSATVPLGVLDSFPDLQEALSGIPLERSRGPVSMALSAPAVDSQTLLAALCLPPRPERLRTGLALGLTLDPQAPATGRGEIRLSGLEARVEDSRVSTVSDTPGDDLVVRLRGGRLEIPAVRLRVDGPEIEGAGISLAGSADLSPTWNPFRDEPAGLVERVAFRGDGTLDAVLLQPFLEGMAASGPLTLNAEVTGPPADLQASLRLSGPEASFFLPGPFATRIQQPEALLTVRGDFVELDSATALINGGRLSLTGGATFDGDVALKARLTGARYRLPDLYSLSASLSGEVDLTGPFDGDRWHLDGSAVVDRGVIDSDINLDQEVLAFLRPQEDAGDTDPGILGRIDLDLSFETVDGVRVRNNVGDLRAVWNPLAVRGTLAAPEVYGRIELESGGLVEVYGQTARIDRGALIFSGPPTEPEPALSVTTSLQDPTIARLRGRSPLDQLDRPRFDTEESLDLEQSLQEGIAGYYGERVGSRLGRSLGLTLRPVLLFQEEDPTARLTVTRELSANASFALSLDLRNAERQAYLLDLHDFHGLPRFTAQGFRTAEDTYGGSLQQTLELGGSPEPETDAPLLRRVRWDVPETLSRWTRLSLRRAVRLGRGDPVPAGAPFDLEVDLAQSLRRRGYPDARATVTLEPVEAKPGRRRRNRDRADLRVAIEPGPRVEFVFAGEAPPRAVRPSITSLYRTDFYEAQSREEVRRQAVRVFRSLGHPTPEVTVEVQTADPAVRTVVVRSEPGPRIPLETVIFEGIAADAAQTLLARRFGSRLARIETAEALPEADRRLLDDLRGLGYPEARIAGRELAPDGSMLTLRIEPGTRQTVATASVSGMTGVEGEEKQRLEQVLPVRSGDPFRSDRVSSAAFYLEEELLRRGFYDAKVLASHSPAASGQVDVTFQVNPGQGYQIAGVEFEGQRWARESRLRRAAGLEAGGPLSEEELNEARTRLFQTGLFTRVEREVDRGHDGQARVAFSLLERPRFRFSYGVRWDSEEEASAVVDFVDQNLLGRGLTLGLRTLYEPDDRSGRLFLQTGGLFGSKISLETYGELREIRTEDDFGALLESRTEGALQLSRPFGEDTTARVYLRRRESRVREEEPDPFFPFDVKVENTYAGVQSIYDGRDDVIDPTKGLFASLDLSGSGAFLGSDFEYARLFGQLNLYRKVTTWRGRPVVWAQSTRLGLADGFGGQELSRDVRFFAGGETSVRGYETESLGPEEVLGSLRRPAGGEALVVINEELRFPVLADLSALVFLDLGQVWTEVGDVDTDLARSLGLGLRARTPVGLLRGDVAFPLDRRDGDPGYRFYIGFGNAF